MLGCGHTCKLIITMTKVFRRSCSICEAACGLRIHVDTQQRQVLKVEGDPDDFRSQGFVCPKSQAMKGIFEDPQRLRQPHRKQADGSWRPISWDEALAETTSRLLAIREQHGFESLAVYLGNPIGFDAGGMLYSTHFMRALMTPRVFTAATMDHFPKLFASKALYGRGNILPIPDIDRCDYFLCLGANPVISQGSLMSAPGVKKRLQGIKDRGGKLVVIDPRRSETAAIADESHAIVPGTDVYLLLAMVHVIMDEGLVKLGHLAGNIDGLDSLAQLVLDYTPQLAAEKTGIEASTIIRLAREYAAAERACCYGRIGTCTVEFGGLTSWLLDVLGLITGHMDVQGSMMFPRPPTGELEAGPETSFDIGRWHSAVRGSPEIDGQLPSAVLAEEIDSAPPGRQVKAMVVVAGNPVLSTANGSRLDAALQTLDFMVAVDFYINETTRHADIILPPLTQLEQENVDALAPGTAVRNFIRYSEQVFSPIDDGMPQWQILLELAARLNGKSADEFEADLLASQAKRLCGRHPAQPEVSNVIETLQELPAGPMRLLELMLRCGPYGDGFQDSSAGGEICLDRLKETALPVDLGAMEPRLLEIIRTPGGRIQLVPECLAADLERLASREDDSAWPLKLVGRRSLQDMNTWLHNLPALAKGKPRCVLQVNPGDAARLGLSAGALARVRSRVGEVQVAVALSDDVSPGVVSLPHGFGHHGVEHLSVASNSQPGANSNHLTDEQVLDTLTGTSVANGIPVSVLPVN